MEARSDIVKRPQWTYHVRYRRTQLISTKGGPTFYRYQLRRSSLHHPRSHCHSQSLRRLSRPAALPARNARRRTCVSRFCAARPRAHPRTAPNVYYRSARYIGAMVGICRLEGLRASLRCPGSWARTISSIPFPFPLPSFPFFFDRSLLTYSLCTFLFSGIPSSHSFLSINAWGLAMLFGLAYMRGNVVRSCGP